MSLRCNFNLQTLNYLLKNNDRKFIILQFFYWWQFWKFIIFEISQLPNLIYLPIGKTWKSKISYSKLLTYFNFTFLAMYCRGLLLTNECWWCGGNIETELWTLSLTIQSYCLKGLVIQHCVFEFGLYVRVMCPEMCQKLQRAHRWH